MNAITVIFVIFSHSGKKYSYNKYKLAIDTAQKAPGVRAGRTHTSFVIQTIFNTSMFPPPDFSFNDITHRQKAAVFPSLAKECVTANYIKKLETSVILRWKGKLYFPS